MILPIQATLFFSILYDFVLNNEGLFSFYFFLVVFIDRRLHEATRSLGSGKYPEVRGDLTRFDVSGSLSKYDNDGI